MKLHREALAEAVDPETAAQQAKMLQTQEGAVSHFPQSLILTVELPTSLLVIS